MERLSDARFARGRIRLPHQLLVLAGVALALSGCPSNPPTVALTDATSDGAVTDGEGETSVDSGDTSPLGSDDADSADSADSPDSPDSIDAAEPDVPSPVDTAVDSDGDVLTDAAPDGEADAAPDATADVAADAPLSQFNGLGGQALRDALKEFTEQPHTPLGYTAARDAMYAFGGLEDDNGRIGCVYTGRTVDTDGSRTPSDNCKRADGVAIACDFNTEHSWAKYYLRLYLTEFTPEYDAAEGDIHHLFPADSNVNSKRWHFDFLDTDCLGQGNCAVDELSQLGLRPGGSGDPTCPTGNLDKDKDCVMQVRPQRQGDIARAQLYMAVRYDMPVDDATEAALRAWNDADPPDVWEMNRNDGAEGAQGNRNPFIDRPDFVALILDF